MLVTTYRESPLLIIQNPFQSYLGIPERNARGITVSYLALLLTEAGRHVDTYPFGFLLLVAVNKEQELCQKWLVT